jgi:hypothetical protein
MFINEDAVQLTTFRSKLLSYMTVSDFSTYHKYLGSRHWLIFIQTMGELLPLHPILTDTEAGSIWTAEGKMPPPPPLPTTVDRWEWQPNHTIFITDSVIPFICTSLFKEDVEVQ